MANYYHEARAQVRNMKKSEGANRRRAERRAELATARVRAHASGSRLTSHIAPLTCGTLQIFDERNDVRLQEDLPVHRLQIDGRACKVHSDTQEYENVEHMKIMVPWNGDHACMIDRFDARAMLDFYQEPSGLPAKRSDEDREVDEVLRLFACSGRARGIPAGPTPPRSAPPRLPRRTACNVHPNAPLAGPQPRDAVRPRSMAMIDVQHPPRAPRSACPSRASGTSSSWCARV
jgi:Alternative splicing regulator